MGRILHSSSFLLTEKIFAARAKPISSSTINFFMTACFAIFYLRILNRNSTMSATAKIKTNFKK